MDNKSKLEKLLAFSMGIMNGENGKMLIDKYQDAINSLTPHDMIALEDKQLQMGIKPKAIKEDIEKVINVFFKSLSGYDWAKPKEGTFLYYLMLENEALEFRLNQIKKALKKYRGEEEKQLQKIKENLLPLFNELLSFEDHYVKKENILFPYLEKSWKNYRPLKVMWSLHDDIRRKLKLIIEILQDKSAAWQPLSKEIGEYFFLALGMIQKENLVVYPISTETVSEEEWLEMYNQSFEYDFPFIEKPEQKKSVKETVSFSEMSLGFQTETGNLSYEQVLHIFNHLPVDITFVDENDKVRFFSRAKERFFPRSPAIVGRDVRNCHPPESLHVVEKIVNEFKKGTRDVADFRIKMKGKYILIRYFAIRDAQGNYKGVLEVGEDITEISKMTDEKRLLDWE